MNYYFLRNLIRINLNGVEKMHVTIECIDELLETIVEWDQLYIDFCWIHFGEEGKEKEIRVFGEVNDL